MPVEDSQVIAAAIAGSELQIVPAAGHLLQWTHAAEFNRAVLDFLEKTPVRPEPAIVPAAPDTFRAATARTLARAQAVVESGRISGMLTVDSVQAQVGVLLNELLNAERSKRVDYKCFFTTSRIEAIDAAIRLARERQRIRQPNADGRALVLDTTGELQVHFDPLHVGTTRALIPGVEIVRRQSELRRRLRRGDPGCAVVVPSSLPLFELNGLAQLCEQRNLLLVLDDVDVQLGEPFVSARLARPADMVVKGESVIEGQAPFGVCAVRDGVHGPWAVMPNGTVANGKIIVALGELSFRNVFSNYALPAVLAREILLARYPALKEREEVRSTLATIQDDDDAKFTAYRRYVSPGLADGLRLHGWHGTMTARGSELFYALPPFEPRRMVDLMGNISSAPRGHNPEDLATGVLANHASERDYWRELCDYVFARTPFQHALQAVSNSSAVDTAIALALLARPQRRRIVSFAGGHGWTMISGAVAAPSTGPRNVAGPLYTDSIVIDPRAPEAAAQLEEQLTSGEVALVWFEPIAVEWGGVRPVPQSLLDLVNAHKEAGGYLVGV
jgi:acetylornithine/succinyldiaminopimelate/putrescine aminotransferase